MTIEGLHHITLVCSNVQRTVDFYTRVLGQRLVKKTVNFDDPGSYHLYFGDETGRPGTAITYFEWSNTPKGRAALGGTHHYAFSVPGEATKQAFREKLIKSGYRVSPAMDRSYFKSIYANDPDGHIVELATAGPGLLVDEGEATLGQALKLPAWLEVHRSDIEANLAPISAPDWPLAGQG
jgi:glyoxalase family protein